MAESSERALTPDEASCVAAARDKAFVLDEPVRTPHRSCGIARAETFGLATPAYQALRRGGITDKGACGAIRTGEQALGELLGDPDPVGAVTEGKRSIAGWGPRDSLARGNPGGVTPARRGAVTWYQAAWQARLVPDEPHIVCDNLVRRHGEVAGPARKAFCTNLPADVAALTAEALCRFAPSRPAIIPFEDK